MVLKLLHHLNTTILPKSRTVTQMLLLLHGIAFELTETMTVPHQDEGRQLNLGQTRDGPRLAQCVFISKRYHSNRGPVMCNSEDLPH